ncbi:ASCH domain-containing protein [Streptomyces marincola]|uniref:ASCH domain-containing protein n=1 Tax=Streptomyces marincola TaxID=2878388 RepID=A0A1W7D4D5_9ACTN|nr:ASCH domain-containing protein [Streptomyces marincola]ARQ71938.1 hypothetical protein CAG99_26665 [Streptomyces marincola]
MTTEPSAQHALNIRKPYFDLIASGSKTIEIRVGYPKIRKMGTGDSLRFTSRDHTLTTRITALHEYQTFEAMLDAEDHSAIGEPGMSRDQLLAAACRDIYPPEKEAFGVFAIHLQTNAYSKSWSQGPSRTPSVPEARNCSGGHPCRRRWREGGGHRLRPHCGNPPGQILGVAVHAARCASDSGQCHIGTAVHRVIGSTAPPES